MASISIFLFQKQFYRKELYDPYLTFVSDKLFNLEHKSHGGEGIHALTIKKFKTGGIPETHSSVIIPPVPVEVLLFHRQQSIK